MPEPDVTKNLIRIRVKDPDQYVRFRTIDIDKAKGISAVIGFKKGGGSEVQSYLFDKKKWTVDRARAWVKSHKEDLGGGRGAGGTDECICPKCGYETKHEKGIPCNQMKCPKCGTMMTGKDMPKTGKGQETFSDIMKSTRKIERYVLEKNPSESISLEKLMRDNKTKSRMVVK